MRHEIINQSYIERTHKERSTAGETRSLLERVASSPTGKRKQILRDVDRLSSVAGLSYALTALYRQQVNSGFVLGDPTNPKGKIEKTFYDPDTDITFRLQWNPERELRRDRDLLVERRVVAGDIDPGKLINLDSNGVACFLCESNIKLQFPKEILLEMELAGERFFAGANFAYIVNNHFTIMNARHRDPATGFPSQLYRSEIPSIMSDFLYKTDGCFRVIFNGRAGASILDHEHLQATTEKFPVEDIRFKQTASIGAAENVKISNPPYYLPLILIEGRSRGGIESEANKAIRQWHKINEEDHTVNIIAVKNGQIYRFFIFLRDRNKLAAGDTGKKGAIAAFEVGGNIVLSHEPAEKGKDTDEKHTFKGANLDTVKNMLKAVSPERARYTDFLDSSSSIRFGNVSE